MSTLSYSHCVEASSEANDVVPTVMMTGLSRLGHTFRDPLRSCCPPNLLGGSPRTTAPGCIRPPPVPGTQTNPQDGRLLDGASSRLTGTTASNDSVELFNQRPASQTSHANAAGRKVTDFKTSDVCCLDRQSVGITARCSDETKAHDEHERRDNVSGMDATIGVSSVSELKQNKTEVLCGLQLSPFNPTPPYSSQTLPTDVTRGLQSFQILSSKSPSDVDAAHNQSHGVSRFFSRVSLGSLRRLFVATTDGSRGCRSAASSSASGRRRQTSKTPADCSAPSKDSLPSSAAQSPHRRWFGRFRRRDVPRRSGSGDITIKTSVSGSISSVPSTVVGCDVSANVASMSRCVTDCERGAAPVQRRERATNASGTADSCIDGTVPKRTSETTVISRLLQPPTSLTLPVPRGLSASPRHWQVRRRRCPMSSCESAESVGQCSMDVFTSTDAG